MAVNVGTVCEFTSIKSYGVQYLRKKCFGAFNSTNAEPVVEEPIYVISSVRVRVIGV